MEKKYVIAYPFSAEWCYERNGELRPENVMAGSDRKVWWKCSKCGHEWQRRVFNQ